MNPIVKAAIQIVIKFLIGSDVFARIENQVKIWADKEISGLQKKEGVLAAIQIIGLEASKSIVNFGIELAVIKLKNK
jgi:hypothetical protein